MRSAIVFELSPASDSGIRGDPLALESPATSSSLRVASEDFAVVTAAFADSASMLDSCSVPGKKCLRPGCFGRCI